MTMKNNPLPYRTTIPWLDAASAVEKVASAKTSRKALTVAGLDWEVAMGRVWGPNPVNPTKPGKPIDGKRSVYRTDSGLVLGYVSPTYQPWQNLEALDFMDGLRKDGEIKYVAAGEMHGGKQIWLVAQLGEGVKVGGEAMNNYLILRAGHGGGEGGAIAAVPFIMRPSCFNLYSFFTQEGTARQRGGIVVKITHITTMRQKLVEAERILELTHEGAQATAKFLNKANSIKCDTSSVEAVQQVLFGPLDDNTSPQRRRAIETFLGMYAAETVVVGKTVYALANAVTGYADHALKYNGASDIKAERRLVSVIDGASEKFKVKGMTAIRKEFGAAFKEAS